MIKSPFTSITKEDELLYGVMAKPKAQSVPSPKIEQTKPNFTASSTPDSNKPINDIAARNINETESSKEEYVRVDDAVKPIQTAGNGYAGDSQDEDTTPLKDTGFDKLEFLSPDELLSVYDVNIREQTVVLHKWQREVSEELSSAKPTQLNPFKYILCACNGSGKDAFVIAPFAIWFALSKIQSRCIITSSSGVQLTSQTESYIVNLARKVNEFHGAEIFKIRQRYIKCRLSGSEIRLFATDEEGKAEGYHPLEPNSEMAIIINEGKSVSLEIYRALRRCTGYNYWIEVSTPGSPVGDFYTHFTTWSHCRRVDTYSCPHLSKDELESDKLELGEHSALFRSKHLALFTSAEGDCIISKEVVDRGIKYSRENNIKPTLQHWPIRVGIDLAAGGDENVGIAARGNTIIKKLCFREVDTTVTARRFDLWLTDELKLPKDHPHVYADDGGVGKSCIDQLNSNFGWNVARINNQSPASNKKLYINRGAENWYRVKRILEENLWFFRTEDELDSKFLQQLYTRYYKQQSTQGRIALESKPDAKANGRPSPDRADAFILAFTGLSVSDFMGEDKVNTDEPVKQKRMNGEQLEQWHDDTIVYKQYEEREQRHNRVSRGPMTVGRLMNSKHNRRTTYQYEKRNS